jgi:hypothetical protein
MVYTNLWVIDRVPNLDWFEQTLPRVLMMALVILYIALIWLTPMNASRGTVSRVRRWRATIALSLIVITVLVPTALFIQHRIEDGPSPDNVIDWPLQIEAGSALLLQGTSPYGVDYSDTEMTIWSERANFPENPAIRHAIHLPVNFILGALAMPLSNGLLGWFDARLLLIAAYLAVVVLAPKLTMEWEDGHALQIGLALNPLLVDSFVVGLSDYLLLAWLLLAFVLRQRGYIRFSAAVLGLAIATRQFSWLLMPVFFAAEWFALSTYPFHERARILVRRMWPLAVVAGVSILPFFLHNPYGFYVDIIAFGSGGIADAYPIGGPESFGLSAVVLALGWVTSQNDQFPFFNDPARLHASCYCVCNVVAVPPQHHAPHASELPADSGCLPLHRSLHAQQLRWLSLRAHTSDVLHG